MQTLASAEEEYLSSKSVKTTAKVKVSKKKSSVMSTLSTRNEISQSFNETATITQTTTNNSTKNLVHTETIEQQKTSSNQQQHHQLCINSTDTKVSTSKVELPDYNNDSVRQEQKTKRTKSKKNKKTETEQDNISVKTSSFSKFDAIQKSKSINVRLNDVGKKAYESFSFSTSPVGEKEINCKICSKLVYKMEEIKAEKVVFHKNCFRCQECKKQLNVDNYQSHEGILYCAVHFKALFSPKVQETEPEKPKKPELIIRENQPLELPPDVVRSSDKPDLGLEELQQLNVRSRFQVFENFNATKEKAQIEPSDDQIATQLSVKRGSTIRSKLAKLQANGITAGIAKDGNELDKTDYKELDDEDSDNDGDDDINDENNDDRDLVRSKKRTQRERPIGIGQAMDDIRTKFEKGNLSKEERREERKQEIQNIRSRLFMGKQAKIKEMYQQAVAESEQAIISVGKKKEIEVSENTRSIKERFEKGEMFDDTNSDSLGTKANNLNNEADVFESAISKQSRTIFMELDANVNANKDLKKLHEHPATATMNTLENKQQDIIPKDIIRYGDETTHDDFKVETSEISSKFNFFETYRPAACERKAFRITPPREGVVKMPTPEDNDHGAALNQHADNEKYELERSHTATKVLSKFREIEQTVKARRNEQLAEPKPLKRFTPPRDGGKRMYSNASDGDDTGGSQEEEGEDEDDENDDDENGNEMHHGLENDEALKEARAAARASRLREKFEKWEANEIQREINEGRVDYVHPARVSDEASIESTKALRERFENIQSAENKIFTSRPRYQVKRFV